MLREFLNAFQGNELIIGVFLAVWMIYTAAGSLIFPIGNKLQPPAPGYSLLFIALAILPLLSVAGLYGLNHHFFPGGTMKGVLPAILFCLLLLLPFCLFSGYLFITLARQMAGRNEKGHLSGAYSYESTGSAAAGILFSLVLSTYLDNMQVLDLVAGLYLLAYLTLPVRGKPGWITRTIIAVSLLVMVLLLSSETGKLNKTLLYAGQQIMQSRDTPYGNLTVTKTGEQFNFFENGNYLFSSGNSAAQEESVHFACLQPTSPVQVLVVSGGMAAMQEQVLKYHSVQRIDYLEINPWIVSAERAFCHTELSSKFHLVLRDARQWIAETSNLYDVILVNIPDPTTAQINRFYTLEFFREAKQRLHSGGYVSISLSPALNYMSPEAERLNRLVYNTLKRVFLHVDILPDERNYFIASDSPVRKDIAKLVSERNIQNAYVNSGYIDDRLFAGLSNSMENLIRAKPSALNRDTHPLGYLLQIQYWLSSFNEKNWLLIPVFLFLLFLAFRNTNPVSFAILTGGYAGASAEFILILLYQAMFGYIYQMVGLIIGLYMMGLGVGARLGGRFLQRSRNSYQLIQLVLVLLLVSIPLIYSWLTKNSSGIKLPGQTILLSLTFLIALVSGFEFQKASLLLAKGKERSLYALYAIDLSGSSLGLIMTSLFLFPMIGLNGTSLVNAGLNLLALGVYMAFGKKP